MDSNWIENIYNSIRDYSDIEKQRKLWLGFDKNNCSSYDEDLSLLFDSFCFDEFIDEWIVEKRDAGILNELQQFKVMLENYEKKGADEDVLEDPDWSNIVSKANQIINLWKFKK